MSNITDLDIINELYRLDDFISTKYIHLSTRTIDILNNVAETLIKKDTISMEEFQTLAKIKHIDFITDYTSLKPGLIGKIYDKLIDSLPKEYAHIYWLYEIIVYDYKYGLGRLGEYNGFKINL